MEHVHEQNDGYIGYIYIYTDGLIYPLGDLISCDVMLVKGDLLNKHEDLSV